MESFKSSIKAPIIAYLYIYVCIPCDYTSVTTYYYRSPCSMISNKNMFFFSFIFIIFMKIEIDLLGLTIIWMVGESYHIVHIVVNKMIFFSFYAVDICLHVYRDMIIFSNIYEEA